MMQFNDANILRHTWYNFLSSGVHSFKPKILSSPPPRFDWNQEKFVIFLYKVVKTDDFSEFVNTDHLYTNQKHDIDRIT